MSNLSISSLHCFLKAGHQTVAMLWCFHSLTGWRSHDISGKEPELIKPLRRDPFSKQSHGKVKHPSNGHYSKRSQYGLLLKIYRGLCPTRSINPVRHWFWHPLTSNNGHLKRRYPTYTMGTCQKNSTHLDH